MQFNCELSCRQAYSVKLVRECPEIQVNFRLLRTKVKMRPSRCSLKQARTSSKTRPNQVDNFTDKQTQETCVQTNSLKEFNLSPL